MSRERPWRCSPADNSWAKDRDIWATSAKNAAKEMALRYGDGRYFVLGENPNSTRKVFSVQSRPVQYVVTYTQYCVKEVK